MTERYINPHTDFAFKRLFGSEFNKELLISFLNALFNGKQVVTDVTYLNSEHLGERADSRRAVFDVYCQNEKGERFIVEMQNVFQNFFKDRTVYYSTFPIREQAQRGSSWDYCLNAVYTIGLLNFCFTEKPEDAQRLYHEVMLMDVDTKEVFYDKLTYVYVEIPKFNKREDELVTLYDKWMYVLKNLQNLMSRPAALQERVFTRLFEQAEIAKFNADELMRYEDSLNAYRDIANAIDSARSEGEGTGFVKGRQIGHEEGMAEGMEKGIKQGIEQGRSQGATETALSIARNLLEMGNSVASVARATHLDEVTVRRLAQEAQ